MRQPRWRPPILAIVAALPLSFAPDAGAEPPPAAEPEIADPCAGGAWNLDGASALPDQGDETTLPEAWREPLARLATCLNRPKTTRACLAIQGRFDGLGFSPAVVAAFGSISAAQQARARGRASLVLQELAKAGAPAERLRELPPPAEPSFRGVAVTWLSTCLPESPALGEGDRRILDEARRIVEARALERSSAMTATAAPPPPERPSPFFLAAAAHASAGFGEPATVVAPGLRGAVGFRTSRLVLEVGVGGAVASREEQRLAAEVFSSAAYRLRPWLELGPVAGLRAGAPDPVEPWLERSWFAGVEATECVLPLGGGIDLCLKQAVLPFGGQLARGEVEDGSVVRVPARSHDRTRLEVSVALRNQL